MINQFKVGCNFDWELIDKASQLNDKYKNQAVIKEFFASPSSSAPMTARPDWRLPNMSNKDFEKYVRLCLDNNIYFNLRFGISRQRNKRFGKKNLRRL